MSATAFRQVVLLNWFVEQANRPVLSLWHDLFNKPHDRATQFMNAFTEAKPSDGARKSATYGGRGRTSGRRYY
jgi:hypothetical protein